MTLAPGLGWKRLEWGAVALIGLAGFFLRLGYLGAADLWGDEAVSWAVAAGDLARLPSRLVHFEAKPPLYFLALHFWMRCFGDSERALRALSALCWLPLVPLLTSLGRRCCGRWALVALGLAAASPLLVYYGVEARPYAFLLLAETTFAWLLLKATESDSLKLRIALAAASFIVVSIQFTGLFFLLPLLGAYLIAKRNDRTKLLSLFLPQAAAGLLFLATMGLYLPGIFAQLGRLEGSWWAPAPSFVQVASAGVRLFAPVSSWHFYLGKPVLIFSAAALSGFALFGLIVSPKRGFLIAASVGVALVFVIYSVFRANLLFPRYYIGCAPILFIAVASALEWAQVRWAWKGALLLAAVAACQGAVFAALPPFERVPEYHRAVDAILAREAGAVTILTAGWDGPSVRYYSRAQGPRLRLSEGSEALEPALQASAPLYYVESFAWKDRTGALDREFARLKPARTLFFESAGVQVFRLSPSNP